MGFAGGTNDEFCLAVGPFTGTAEILAIVYRMSGLIIVDSKVKGDELSRYGPLSPARLAAWLSGKGVGL